MDRMRKLISSFGSDLQMHEVFVCVLEAITLLVMWNRASNGML